MPPVEMLPSEVEATIEIALKENPAVANSDANIEAAKERRRSVKAEYMPTFDLVGRWNYLATRRTPTRDRVCDAEGIACGMDNA